jgi:2-oxoglutarate dehydrogenase complex dehydrogenase (E1) component-like enzyme
MKPSLYGEEYPTGFDIKMLNEFSRASVSYPSNFSLHARIKKYFVDERLKSL